MLSNKFETLLEDFININLTGNGKQEHSHNLVKCL